MFCRIGVDSLECLQSLYEPCLKQYSRLYFTKNYIKKTKKYVKKHCTENFEKGWYTVFKMNVVFFIDLKHI